MVKVGSFFDDELKQVSLDWGMANHFDNTETKEILGIDFIDIKKSVLDMAEAMVETGYIEEKTSIGYKIMQLIFWVVGIFFHLFFFNDLSKYKKKM